MVLAKPSLVSSVSAALASAVLVMGAASPAAADFPGDYWSIGYIKVAGSNATVLRQGLQQAADTYFYGSDLLATMRATGIGDGRFDLEILDASGKVVASERGLAYDPGAGAARSISNAALAWMDRLSCDAGCAVASAGSSAPAADVQIATAAPAEAPGVESPTPLVAAPNPPPREAPSAVATPAPEALEAPPPPTPKVPAAASAPVAVASTVPVEAAGPVEEPSINLAAVSIPLPRATRGTRIDTVGDTPADPVGALAVSPGGGTAPVAGQSGAAAPAPAEPSGEVSVEVTRRDPVRPVAPPNAPATASPDVAIAPGEQSPSVSAIVAAPATSPAPAATNAVGAANVASLSESEPRLPSVVTSPTQAAGQDAPSGDASGGPSGGIIVESPDNAAVAVAQPAVSGDDSAAAAADQPAEPEVAVSPQVTTEPVVAVATPGSQVAPTTAALSTTPEPQPDISVPQNVETQPTQSVEEQLALINPTAPVTSPAPASEPAAVNAAAETVAPVQPDAEGDVPTQVETKIAAVEPAGDGPTLANARWIGFTPAVFSGGDNSDGAWIAGPFDRQERKGWITDTATGATTRVSFIWRDAATGSRTAVLSREAARALGLGQGDVANVAVYLPR